MVLLVLRLVERMVRMRRQDGRRHQRVSVVQEGRDARGQAAAEGRRHHLPQRLGFVQQDVLDEEGRGPLRGNRRRRVVQTHDCDFDHLLFPLDL